MEDIFRQFQTNTKPFEFEMISFFVLILSITPIRTEYLCPPNVNFNGQRVYQQLKSQRFNESESELYEYYMTNKDGFEWKFDIVFNKNTKQLELSVDWTSAERINRSIITRFDGLISGTDYQMNVNCDFIRGNNKSVDCQYTKFYRDGTNDSYANRQDIDFIDEAIFLRCSIVRDTDRHVIQFQRDRFNKYGERQLVIVNHRDRTIERLVCRDREKLCLRALDSTFITQMDSKLYLKLDSTVYYSISKTVTRQWKDSNGYLLWFVIDGQPYYCFQPESTSISDMVSL